MKSPHAYLLILGLLGFMACSDTPTPSSTDAGGDTGPEPAEIVSLEVLPATLRLQPGQQELLEAYGTSSSGERKRAQNVIWKSDDETVATINLEGVLTAVGAGSTEVWGVVGAVRATAEVLVIADPSVLPPSALTYKSPVTYFAGQAIEPNAPVSQGGAATRYQVSPSLPPGLYLDEATGVISGTPRIPVARVVYTITASNRGGSAVALISLAVECDVNAPPSPSDDVPDAMQQDSNGDGIDGMRCGPIFVANDGDDAQVGTLESPVRTLRQAILLASSYDPPRAVYVANGRYDEQILVTAGVHLYGGYDRSSDWRRVSDNWAIVRGASPVLSAVGIEVATTISQLELHATDASAASAPSFAAYVKDNAAELRFERVVFRAGRGGDGISGVAGWDGFWGDDGWSGESGCEPEWVVVVRICGSDTLCEMPWFGLAGLSATEGGSGGAGGEPGLGDESGRAGLPGAGGAGGGAGGVEEDDGEPGRGGDGQSGANGAHGTPGAGGASGKPGADGGDGTPGEGGGGGGGGAGNADNCDSYGGAGGGGGAGGEGGTGGEGGAAGGASIALVVENADVHLENVGLIPGIGGAGGAGGTGGYGGAGGFGGIGGTGLSDSIPGGDSGAGGSGGAGGNGGDGGHGGGGGGGNAIAVLADDLARLNVVDARFETGAGGVGGGGPGIPGEAGKTLDYLEGTFLQLP